MNVRDAVAPAHGRSFVHRPIKTDAREFSVERRRRGSGDNRLSSATKCALAGEGDLQQLA